MAKAISDPSIGAGNPDFLAAVLSGLDQPQKQLSAKYFYDAEGSRLFEAITSLDEYYPTRTEVGLLRAHGPEIAALTGPQAEIVEMGSGSSLKIRVLLEALDSPARYIPVDISDEPLGEAAHGLRRDFPHLAVVPVHADFTRPFALPEKDAGHRLAFFPGSTIGNFRTDDARAILVDMATTVGPGGAMVIGVDLRKAPSILHRAYNDSSGVTAAFNLNVLARINNELEGNFDLDAFSHYAPYNLKRGCVEMHLVSLRRQTVTIAGRHFFFAEGESIHTEDSIKYTVADFQTLAETAGWRTRRSWTDADRLFSLHYLDVA